MGKLPSTALLVSLAYLPGFSSAARAGVTIDVVFQNGTGHLLPISPGDTAAPGCVFSGYYGTVVTGVRCMDVMLISTHPIIGMGVSVTYDNDNGLDLDDMYEWKGVGFETVSAYIDSLVDGVIAIIDGNIVNVGSSVVLGPAMLGSLISEPGTAALLGLGLLGLALRARRRRPQTRPPVSPSTRRGARSGPVSRGEAPGIPLGRSPDGPVRKSCHSIDFQE